jgi:hypothetical protein
MTDRNEATEFPPVSLAALAIEMGTTIEAVETDLAGHVFMAGGFRSVTAFKARQVLEDWRRRQAEDEAEAKRQSEAVKASHAAARERAIADRANTESRVEKFGLSTITINPNPTGVLPVVAMTANADLDFDGATQTPRPSHMDWLTGKAEGGAEIGPSRRQMNANAKAAKAAKKGKGTS